MVHSHGNLYLYYTKRYCESRMGIIMVNYECESVDNGKTKWIVLKDERILVITTSEELAMRFYNEAQGSAIAH